MDQASVKHMHQKIPLLALLFTAVLLSCNGPGEKIPLPALPNGWWQLTTTYPDITPYAYTGGDNKVCDFTIFPARDGTWQLIACVRGNTYPGSNRFLYRWEAGQLTDTLWEEKGVFLATGSGPGPDGFGFAYDSTHYPQVGKLQAPHCIQVDSLYNLFYNNRDAHCLVSSDGKDFTPLRNDMGSLSFFRMGRDVMVFRDDPGQRWIAYYTDPETRPQSVSARTSSSLSGKWSEAGMVYDGYSGTRSPIYRNEFAESPFVHRIGEDYYLFAQLHVFHSKDPLAFSEKVAVLESCRYEERCWAPEIISGPDNRLYLAAYRPGRNMDD